jgi:hypothetical protein
MPILDLEDALHLVARAQDASSNWVGGATEEAIATAESLLGYPLPPTYRTFVQTLGARSITRGTQLVW